MRAAPGPTKLRRPFLPRGPGRFRDEFLDLMRSKTIEIVFANIDKSPDSGTFQTDQRFHAIGVPQIGPGFGGVGNDGREDFGREGVTVAMHLCRGNNRSQWYAEGGYDPIAERLFNQLNVDVFLLEYDSERAGTFDALRFVPRTKAVVLGLVSSKIPQLEPRDQLIRRIEDASRHVPLENLAVSPQCGFASTMEGNLLSEQDQWRKLELVVDTARQVWTHA